MLKKSAQIEQFFEVDGVFVEKRQVSLWEFGLFVIGIPPALLSENLCRDLQNLCKKEKCLFVQIETLDYNSDKNQKTHIYSGIPSFDFAVESPLSISIKRGKYYKKFIPPHTALINLTQSQEEILAAMKPKGRYNIRLAEKKWVVVEQVEKTQYNTKIFYDLMAETTARDAFSGNSLHYYEIFLWSIEDSQLFFAYYEKQVIAAGIFVSSTETILYYYGASSSQYRNLMAPYLLQWTVICHAQKRGFQFYDFLGIATPGDLKSPLSWVTDFKLKFTSDTRLISESFLYIHKKTKFFFIMLLKKFKRR
jgi:lipid II:glycine glycyltransferase (peptidoglycan interpeptide bridge formation enzyme)